MRILRYSIALAPLFLLACAPRLAPTAPSASIESTAPTPRTETPESTASTQEATQAVASASTGGEFTPPNHPACARFRGRIPSDWFQDWLEVPENPAQPSGRKIRVFYYGKINPGTVPVIFFNGGPGGDSHSSFRVFRGSSTPWFLNHEERTSFIFIDQRGMGCSDPYPSGDSAEGLERLSHYGSQGIVSDAEQVRAKVWAGKKWIAVGQSYGAHIVHRYVMNAPEALKAAFAHGSAITPNIDHRRRDRAVSQVRVSEAYFTQYPGDRAAIERLAAYLAPDQCVQVENRKRVCGYDVVFPIAANLIGFRDAWGEIHQWLGAMVTPSGVSPEGIALFVSKNFSEASPGPTTYGQAIRVINWVDRGVMTPGYSDCREARALLLDRGIDLAKLLLSECAASLQYDAAHPEAISSSASVDPYQSLRGIPQDLMTLENLRATLQQHVSLPLYLYSGQLDPYVPVENFAPELAAIRDLPNVHYTNFPDSGHDGYYSETWFWQDLIRESRE